MSKVDDNVFPKVIYGMQTTDQAAPSDSSWKVYSKSNGIFARSSNSVVGPFGSSGSGLTDPMTTRGDMIYRNSSNTTDRLAIPAAGQVIGRSGSDLAAVYPPGYEFDYAQVTSTVNPTATTEATANTVVTGAAVTYDGSTTIMIEFFCPNGCADAGAAARNMLLWLYDGASSIGAIGAVTTPAANTDSKPILTLRRLTPSAAAHTYSIRASVNAGTGTLQAGAGGAGVYPPIYIRQIKV